MALMILMTAIIKLPKAAVPAWYHVAWRREDDRGVADRAPVPREVIRSGRGRDDDLAQRLDELHGPEQVKQHEPEGALLVLGDLERLVGHLQRAV